jgi:recombination protein RecA
VAATTTKEELDKVKKDGLNSRSSMASTARLLSQMCRCIKTDIARDRVAMVFINQVRENVGVMFGEDFTTSGGKAVGFHASLRIQVSRKTIMKDVTDGGTPKGIDVKALIYKNKLARPFAWCEIPMMFEYGIDDATAMFWKLKQDGYMVARGPWHYMQLDKEEIKVQQAGWADLYTERGEEIRQWFYERTV